MKTPTDLIGHFVRTGWEGLRSDLTCARGRRRTKAEHRRQNPKARWRHLAKRAVLGMVLFQLLAAAASFADDGGGQAGSVWFDWLNHKDSHGNAPSAYDLRVTQGGLNDPITKAGAFLLLQFWDIYRFGVSLMVWAFQFVLEFQALEVVREPANAIAQVVQDVTNQLHIVELLAVIAVLVSTVWILKGRSGAGFGEMAVSAVMAALLGTALANPVTFITGENGALVQAKNLGSSITADLLTPDQPMTPSREVDPGDPDGPDHGGTIPDAPDTRDPEVQVKDATSKRMLDVFVRTPHQLLNFGLQIDAPQTPQSCKDAYDKAFKGGSVKPMKSTSVCPAKVKDTMENPEKSLVGTWVIAWAVGFTFIFGLILLLGGSFLIGLAAWEAAKFFLAIVRSILPGASREGVFTGAATMTVAVALAGTSIIVLGVFLLVLTSIFDATHGWNIVPIYIFVDIASVGAIIGASTMFIKARKRGKQMGRRAAKAMSPQNTPRALPTGRSLGQTALRGATQLAHTKQLTSGRSPGGALQSSPRGLPAGNQYGTQAAQKSSLATKALKGTGMVAKGALAYTVGLPVTAPKAVVAAKSTINTTRNAMRARRDQAIDGAKGNLNSKLTAAKGKAGAAQAYMQEWGHNVKVAGEYAGRGALGGNASGAAAVAHRRHQPKQALNKNMAAQLNEMNVRNGRMDLNMLARSGDNRFVRSYQGQYRTRQAERDRSAYRLQIPSTPPRPAAPTMQRAQQANDRRQDELKNRLATLRTNITQPSHQVHAGGGATRAGSIHKTVRTK